ncbi:MAG: hypothetical protein HYY84_01255 [Deltaproteobacteria bacterium]|nr:hypothetical protein [Deltaproteobacteria bacterium]
MVALALAQGCGDELSSLLATDITFLPSFASAGESATVQVAFSTFDKTAEKTVELVGYTFPTNDVELESFQFNASTSRLEMKILIVGGAPTSTLSLKLKVRVNGACCVEASGPFQIVGL